MIKMLFTKTIDPQASDPIYENVFGFIHSVLANEEIAFSGDEVSIYEPQRQSQIDIVYKNLDFDLTLEKKTVKDTCSIIFNLTIKDQNVDIRDIRISELKILLKELFIGPSTLGTCYWIYDEQSLHYSQDLYLGINRAENLFRSYITTYMLLKHGIGWWDKVANSIKIRKSDRSSGYENALTDLRGINIDLLSIDIGDLTALIENEYLINIEFICLSNQEVPTDHDQLKKLAIAHFKKIQDSNISIKCETKSSFWNDLAKHFSDHSIFKEKWERLCKNRNHIMHNKLIDTNMFKVMTEDNSYIISELQHAIAELGKSVRSEEDSEFSEYVYKTTRDCDLDCLGYSIYNIDEIKEKFQEYISEHIIDPIDDLLHFHMYSLKHQNINEFIDVSQECSLINLIGSTDEAFELTIIESSFDDSEGGQSFVTFKLTYGDSSERRYTLYFDNIDVTVDEDTGQYMPTSDGGFSDNDIYNANEYTNEILEELTNFLNRQAISLLDSNTES